MAGDVNAGLYLEIKPDPVDTAEFLETGVVTSIIGSFVKHINLPFWKTCLLFRVKRSDALPFPATTMNCDCHTPEPEHEILRLIFHGPGPFPDWITKKKYICHVIICDGQYFTELPVILSKVQRINTIVVYNGVNMVYIDKAFECLHGLIIYNYNPGCVLPLCFRSIPLLVLRSIVEDSGVDPVIPIDVLRQQVNPSNIFDRGSSIQEYLKKVYRVKSRFREFIAARKRSRKPLFTFSQEAWRGIQKICSNS